MYDPINKSHWQAVKRILHYLKHSVLLGLLISKAADFNLHAFSYLDWAAERDDI